jgi:hypothetical protein
MSKTIISLISDHSIPNLKLIKEFKEETDSFIFLTTEKMEDVSASDFLIMAANISSKKTKKILLNPNSLSDIENTLFDINEDTYTEYLVNITGGTKLMAIASLNYFSAFQNVKIIYVPIGLNYYRQIFPRIQEPNIVFNENLNLIEYLTAYKLKITSKSHTVYNAIIAKNMMQKTLIHKSDLTNIAEIKKAHTNKDPFLRVYYSGKWFEEYIYFLIKTTLKLKKSEIATSVEIEHALDKNIRNEYDVIFVYQNKIYVIECKAYQGTTNLKAKLEKDLYKLGALDDDFGLIANSILITTFDLYSSSKKINNIILKRAKSVGVKFLQSKELENEKYIIQQIIQ